MNEPRRVDVLAELGQLRKENARLKSLLIAHGIHLQEMRDDGADRETMPQIPRWDDRHLDSAAKVSLFRRMFNGRSDVYAIRWESAKAKSGYALACDNEWQPGVCGKPQVKCADCDQRKLRPVTDQVVYDHLSGKHTVGVYPLLSDDTCFFLAVDFDEADWQGDARAFMQSCLDLQVPAAIEVSRSGEGAHVWLFFAEAVPARDARLLGSALISYTCARTRQLRLSSYDRLFPNQDSVPKGGFGNLIALPLQKKPREQGRSVFVDEHFKPFHDQWAFLATLTTMKAPDVEEAIQRATGGSHPIDVAFASDEDEPKPWERPAPYISKIPGPQPKSLTLILANQIFIEKATTSTSYSSFSLSLSETNFVCHRMSTQGDLRTHHYCGVNTLESPSRLAGNNRNPMSHVAVVSCSSQTVTA